MMSVRRAIAVGSLQAVAAWATSCCGAAVKGRQLYPTGSAPPAFFVRQAVRETIGIHDPLFCPAPRPRRNGELRVVLRMALLTSADRGVLLAGRHSARASRGLRVRDVQIFPYNETGAYSGEVYLHDEKTDKCSRTVPLPNVLCRELVVLCRQKTPDAPVLSMSYSQLDSPFEAGARAGETGAGAVRRSERADSDLR